MVGVERKKKVAQGRQRGRRYSIEAISFSSTWGGGGGDVARQLSIFSLGNSAAGERVLGGGDRK